MPNEIFEVLKEAILRVAKDSKAKFILKKDRNKIKEFLASHLSKIITEIFRKKEEKLKLLIINDKRKRRVYVFRMDDVIKFLIKNASDNICFTEKGVIRLGDFITIQRKGGSGKHIKIPKTDWNHPGNQLQFKFSPLKFAEYVDRFTPEYVEAETGVSREVFDKLVEFYLRRPVTVIGFAIGRTENGGDAARAISLLHALLGDPAGFYYSNSGAWGIDFAYLRGLHMAKPSKTVSMGLVGLRISEFHVVYVWNANPVLTLPQGDRIAVATERGDITLAVHTPFMDETAEVAHIVLPAPTYLEKDDVVYSYWHNYLIYNSAVAEPPGEAMRETDVVIKLAEMLNVSDHPLMKEDPWDAVDAAIRGTGVTLRELRERGVVKLKTPDYYRYPTATGKVEFYSETALRRGLPPLPQYTPPKRGLYVLTFPPSPLYTNSQFRDIYGEPPPAVRVNPADYVGDCIVLRNEHGEVQVKAVADPEVPRGVVVYVGIGKDLKRVPINAVARGEPGPYGGTPRLYTTYVQVEPCRNKY